MRIRIVGTSDSAVAVRGMLNQDSSVVVSDVGYLYTVEIVGTDQPYPTVDGVSSTWESKLVDRIAALSQTDILLLRAGGIQTDDRILIGVPAYNAHLVERGIFQAILQMVTVSRASPAPPPPMDATSGLDEMRWIKSEIIALLEEARHLATAPTPAPTGWMERVKAWFA